MDHTSQRVKGALESELGEDLDLVDGCYSFRKFFNTGEGKFRDTFEGLP